MKNNRCLIFGGGGFIGSHLTETLVKNKYPVAVFSCKSNIVLKNLSKVIKKIQFIEGDFNNISSLKKTIKPNDIVFDLVASSVPSSSMQSPVEEIKHHISSHVQLIKVVYQKKVKKIIFISSGGGVYGEKKKLPISEEQIPQPISPHAIAKLTIEYYLHYFGKIYNTPYLIYRLSNPYGPRQVAKKGFAIVPTLFSCILQNSRPILFDNGNLVRDFIYIDDVINAILKSFDKKTQRNVYNIGSGSGTRIEGLWQIMKDITGTKLKPQYKSKRLFDVNSVILDITRFKNEFNWIPDTSLSLGLKKTWEWIKKSSVY